MRICCGCARARFPSLPASRLGRGGTDLATIATFRISGAVGGGDNLVSFEPFSRPGCCLAAPMGSGGGGGSSGGGRVELLCLAPGAQPTAAEVKRVAWRRHDPLIMAAHGAFLSYESVDAPGCFLSSTPSGDGGGGASGGGGGAQMSAAAGYDAGDEAGTRLTPVTLLRKPDAERESAPFKAFANHASFEEAIGKAVYPPAAWYFRPTAKGAGGRAAPQSALVWPLAEVIDETYSVYFDLAG